MELSKATQLKMILKKKLRGNNPSLFFILNCQTTLPKRPRKSCQNIHCFQKIQNIFIFKYRFTINLIYVIVNYTKWKGIDKMGKRKFVAILDTETCMGKGQKLFDIGLLIGDLHGNIVYQRRGR